MQLEIFHTIQLPQLKSVCQTEDLLGESGAIATEPSKIESEQNHGYPPFRLEIPVFFQTVAVLNVIIINYRYYIVHLCPPANQTVFARKNYL